MKVVDIQVSPIHPERWGDDLDVVNAARVSFNKVSKEFVEKDAKLIKYLAEHKHFSPFNHSFISFRIKAPIFVARQLVKHKFMPWNEVSRRYVDDEPEFYFPEYWRAKANNVKQGSSDEEVDYRMFLWDSGRNVVELCVHEYNTMLRNGVAPEQARMILPQNMMSEWIWSGTLGAYAAMLKLRLDPHTQYESRIVAQKIREHIEPVFPVSIPALLGE